MGGQTLIGTADINLELSGATLSTIHETCDEVNAVLREVKSIAEDELNVGFIGLGAAPEWSHQDMPMMPKGTLQLMTDYMDRVGTMGKSMMYRTACVQVNLDFSSEVDMVQKLGSRWHCGICCCSLCQLALFDQRSQKLAQPRCGAHLMKIALACCHLPFDDGFGLNAWVDYALDVPMYFVYRDGKYRQCARAVIFTATFLQGKLPALGRNPDT